MKILLIKPGIESNSGKGQGFQIGLLYIATYLHNNSNHKAEYYDMQIKPSYKKLIEHIKKNKIDVIGITCNSHEVLETFKLTNFLKHKFPNKKIIIGGTHYTIVKNFTPKKNVDIYVFNDGEIRTKEILDKLEKNDNDFSNIEDIAYLKNNQYVINPIKQVNRNLDEISKIDWELLGDINNYGLLLPVKEKPKIVPILTSRGCPFRCNFCAATKVNYRSIRWMSPQLVVDEIEKVIKRYPDRWLFFYDDHFLMNGRRVIEIAQEVNKRGLKFNWGCYSRVDSINEDVIKAVKSFGCKMISFGFESGSERVLKLMNKNVTNKQQIKAIKIVQKYGIVPRCSIIGNYPGEKIKDFIDTLKLLKKLKLTAVEVTLSNRTTVYPGTKVFDDLYKSGYIPKNFSWHKKNKKLPYSVHVPIYENKKVILNAFIKNLYLLKYGIVRPRSVYSKFFKNKAIR